VWLLSANRHLIRYAVPAFFLISGALVWGRPWGGGGRGIYGRFMGRRVHTVLLPYLVWTAVYVTCGLAVGASRTVPQVLAGVVSGQTWYHLYFVPAIMVTYALTPLADRVSRFSPELLLGLALAVHLLAPGYFDESAPFVPFVVERVLSSAAIYLPYAAMGSLVARRRLDRVILLWTWPALLAGSLLLMANRTMFLASDVLMYRSLTAVAALGVQLGALGACEFLSKWTALSSISERLGAYTYGVYLVHPLFIELFGMISAPVLVSFVWHDHIGLWLTWAGVTIASFGVGWAQSRIQNRGNKAPLGSGTVTVRGETVAQ
jgi:surface polysaccharide O-acyltransferase-like enzyme